MKKGFFIVLDGPDGSGTSTHSALLEKRLKSEGLETLLTKEPSDLCIGSFIRTCLQDHKNPLPPDALQLLFCADRAEHIQRRITPALAHGKTVISDRFIPSTLAYGTAQGIAEQWLKSLNKNFIQPDLTFVLLAPKDILCTRIETERPHKDILESSSDIQDHILHFYARMGSEKNVHLIDSTLPVTETHDTISHIVHRSLPTAQST